MPILPLPSAAVGRADEAARRHPDRETLELATAGAAQVLGPDHGVTIALCLLATPALAAPTTRRQSWKTRNGFGHYLCFRPPWS